MKAETFQKVRPILEKAHKLTKAVLADIQKQLEALPHLQEEDLVQAEQRLQNDGIKLRKLERAELNALNQQLEKPYSTYETDLVKLMHEIEAHLYKLGPKHKAEGTNIKKTEDLLGELQARLIQVEKEEAKLN